MMTIKEQGVRAFMRRMMVMAGLVMCTASVQAADSPAAAIDPGDGLTVNSLALQAKAFAPEQIKVTVYLPPGYAEQTALGTRYPVLYANDGQDMAAVGLRETLSRLYAAHDMRPVIVVAVDMLADRASGYGLSDRAGKHSVVGGSRIGPIGTRAYDYSEWVATELVPYIDAHYRTQAGAAGRTVLGWSLGGLNAFNLGWDYPEVFGRVGAFSPSFWLAADRSTPGAVASTRLAQGMVNATSQRKPLRFFLAVGGREETNDRNGNGVIDAVEDTEDLVQGYRPIDGTTLRGLRDLGYRIDMDYAGHPSTSADVAFYLLPDGEHNQATWKRMLPVFLAWAYGAGAP
ncbi:MAG TPA: alpha/beta hydrolase-fold protein [Dyella sp.]|uniref:alpha/beta hydrolase n=1 Tax=Dyella sp. TaxID=1869338 RepID=UPI002D76B300|nr:alpha/beta hydrolase-fold protein [Dyella sp.]HET6554708.1 alpha/beta hydrolase-fold protein [Dyella sp.]